MSDSQAGAMALQWPHHGAYSLRKTGLPLAFSWRLSLVRDAMATVRMILNMIVWKRALIGSGGVIL